MEAIWIFKGNLIAQSHLLIKIKINDMTLIDNKTEEIYNLSLLK